MEEPDHSSHSHLTNSSSRRKVGNRMKLFKAEWHLAEASWGGVKEPRS